MRRKKRDKAQRLIAHSNSNFVLNLNGQSIILIHSYGTLKWGMERAWREKKIHEKFLLMNSNGAMEVRWRMEIGSRWFHYLNQPN